jgi:hypothetical protein
VHCVGAHPSVHSLTATLIPPGTADTYAFRQNHTRTSELHVGPALRAVRRVSIGRSALTGRLAAQLPKHRTVCITRTHAANNEAKHSGPRSDEQPSTQLSADEHCSVAHRGTLNPVALCRDYRECR